MSENDFLKLPVPKESGPEMDLLMVMHMGRKHWSGNELSAKLLLEEGDGKYPAVSIPKFSTTIMLFSIPWLPIL